MSSVAIISGGTRGIGRECALALAREGCKVVIAARSTEEKPNLPGKNLLKALSSNDF